MSVATALRRRCDFLVGGDDKTAGGAQRTPANYYGRKSMSAKSTGGRTLLFATVGLVVVSAAVAQQKPVRVRGTVEAVNGPMLTIKTREGSEVKAKLGDKTRVVAIVKASYADIKQGSFIGVTGMPQADAARSAKRSTSFPRICAAPARGIGRGTSSRTAP
jgi:hypothetical protein